MDNPEMISPCPYCGRLNQRAHTIKGDGWLEGREWTMCIPCHITLQNLCDAAWKRTALEGLGASSLMPPGLTPQERAICDFLGINASEVEQHIPATARLTNW